MGTTPEREKPLYEDTHIKIEYWPDSVDDHRLRIDVGDEPCYYIIPRGILRELARTRRGGIENKIQAFNNQILEAIKRAGIGIDGLHVAFCQAGSEEERRIREDSA